MVQSNFGGKVPAEIRGTNPVLLNQEQAVRDLEIDPALFTPKDQMRPWARAHNWGEEFRIDPAEMMGSPPAKK